MTNQDPGIVTNKRICVNHCWHAEPDPECRRLLRDQKRVLRCCKCGVVQRP